MLLPWSEYRVMVSALGHKTTAVPVLHGVEPTQVRITLERMTEPELTAPVVALKLPHFTRGSHSDEVLRLQGTPSEIQRYDALGKEVWSYGYSTVEIDLQIGRVRQWSNSGGNLKVRM